MCSALPRSILWEIQKCCSRATSKTSLIICEDLCRAYHYIHFPTSKQLIKNNIFDFIIYFFYYISSFLLLTQKNFFLVKITSSLLLLLNAITTNGWADNWNPYIWVEPYNYKLLLNDKKYSFVQPELETPIIDVKYVQNPWDNAWQSGESFSNVYSSLYTPDVSYVAGWCKINTKLINFLCFM